MKIAINEIRKQYNVPFRFHFYEQLGEEEIPDAVAVGAVETEVLLRADSAGLTGELQLQAPVQLSCSRCLQPFPHQLSYSGSFTVRVKEPITEEEQAENWILVQNEQIDLHDMIKEVIIFNVPFRPLCTESCQGLCPGCGADLNHEPCSCPEESIDPRWEKLKQLT